MEETIEILEKLGIDKDIVLKKAIRGKKGITAESLINALLKSNSIKDASILLEYTENPVKQSIRQILIPLFPNRSKGYGNGSISIHSSWKHTLLALINKRFCHNCNQILNYSYFRADKNNTTSGLHSTCNPCNVLKSKEYKRYIIQRTPIWADLEKIKQIYFKCPEGKHVDHEIPLKGKLVSGLHVHNNLQYLTPEENRIKLNKYEID